MGVFQSMNGVLFWILSNLSYRIKGINIYDLIHPRAFSMIDKILSAVAPLPRRDG